MNTRKSRPLFRAGPAPIASEALQRIAARYQIETEIRGRSAEERRAVRQEKSRPILDDLEPWLCAKLALISQKTKLAEAIRYALSRWNGLCRFVDDGGRPFRLSAVTTCSLARSSARIWCGASGIICSLVRIPAFMSLRIW